MNRRTADWHLLGAGDDPVPVDDEAIEAKARHYAGRARLIADQIAELRALASDDQILKGQYAEGLRGDCDDTADDLARIHGRFESVGSRLGEWADDVRTARSETWSQVQRAEAAQRTVDAHPPADPLPVGSDPLSPGEQAARDQSDRDRRAGEDALADARNDFRRTMSTFDSAADSVAQAIRRASDDDMKDSRWDKFKGWVDANADWLKVVADIIGWVVTAVAIAALFLNPAGWLIALVLVVGAIGVGIRGMLAATGNGSWLDFAIDAFGILTLGAGTALVKLAKLGRSLTLLRVGNASGKAAQGSSAAAAVAAFKNAPLFAKPFVWATRSNPLVRGLAGVRSYLTAFNAARRTVLPSVGPLGRVAGGFDGTAIAMRREIARLNAQFPGTVTRLYDDASLAALRSFRANAMVTMPNALFGSSLTDWDEALGLDVPFLGDGKPALGPPGEAWDDFKNIFTFDPGGHLG